MSIEGLVIDAGFLGIAGFGAWRGQSLWGRHIELKHTREMERLGMDRMEKSIRLEIDQNKAMAEIERMAQVPALNPVPVGAEGEFSPGKLAFICSCGMDASWHLHACRESQEYVLPLSLGAIQAIRDGHIAKLCVCGDAKTVHAHDGGKMDPDRSLNNAGYVVRR